MSPLPCWVDPQAALSALAQESGLGCLSPNPDLQNMADQAGLELEPLSLRLAELGRLGELGPALIAVEGGWLALLRGEGHRLRLLLPEGGQGRIPQSEIEEEALRQVEADLATDPLVEALDLPPARRPALRRALLAQRVGDWPILKLQRLRIASWRRAPPAALWTQGALLLGARLGQAAALWGAVRLIGGPALLGQLEPAHVLGGALCLLGGVGLRLIEVLSSAEVALTFGGWLKARLLRGALAAGPDALGVGGLIGRVVESETVEVAVLRGGLLALLAALDLGAALALWSGERDLLGLLASLLALALLLLARQHRRRRAWSADRRGITSDLVASMLGHRTRLAQARPERWHEAEEPDLLRYLQSSVQLDGRDAAIGALLPRALLLGGLLLLLSRWGAPAGELAAAIAGLAVAARALSGLGAGLLTLDLALIALAELRPLLAAARRSPSLPAPELADPEAPPAPGLPLIEGCQLVLRHPGQRRPALDEVDLRVWPGDRVLLCGPSGGGKSTLGALLCGLTRAQSGLLLQRGLDPQSLGEAGWRRRVASAPQFHQNHVLVGTFAYNLLMGRAWPPTPSDLDEARYLCEELGLGPLVERMPAGLQQQVGEGGWRLSHGEQSRLFLARALLQRADLVVLDESFGALDPENLQRCLEVALRRAPTLVVIAHP